MVGVWVCFGGEVVGGVVLDLDWPGDTGSVGLESGIE